MTIEHLKTIEPHIKGVHLPKGRGEGGNLKGFVVEHVVNPKASTGSTYFFGRFPSSVIFISLLSSCFIEGKVKAHLGTFGNFNNQGFGDKYDSLGLYYTYNLNTGWNYNIPSFSDNADYISLERCGKQLWEIHNTGQFTKDPGGFFDVKGTLNMDNSVEQGKITCVFAFIFN